ncbi:MAG TPA: tetratricopeptide repeat protein [Dehalococcoidia bacterium]|nr:tetratricopeptide repeat protein [Dehalococcoidia bacterium]
MQNPRSEARDLNRQAASLMLEGRLDEAIDLLNRAIALSPNYVTPYLNRAEILETQGRLDEAHADLRTARALSEASEAEETPVPVEPPPQPVSAREEASAGTGDQPLHFAIRYPQELSRGLNLPFFIGTFVKLILALPIILVLSLANGGISLGFVDTSDASAWENASFGGSLFIVAPFAILFLRRYPKGLWTLTTGLLRMQARVSVYLMSLGDRWPAFSLYEREDDPFEFELAYAPELNRWLNFPIFGTIVKFIAVIPHFIILLVVGIVVFIVIFLAQFAILFSGRFPAGMFKLVAGWLELSFRVAAYVYSMTDRYPPFELSPSSPRNGIPAPA